MMDRRSVMFSNVRFLSMMCNRLIMNLRIVVNNVVMLWLMMDDS